MKLFAEQAHGLAGLFIGKAGFGVSLGCPLVEDVVQFRFTDQLAVALLDRFQRADNGFGNVLLKGAVAFTYVSRFDLFMGLIGQGREDFDEV